MSVWETSVATLQDVLMVESWWKTLEWAGSLAGWVHFGALRVQKLGVAVLKHVIPE